MATVNLGRDAQNSELRRDSTVEASVSKAPLKTGLVVAKSNHDPPIRRWTCAPVATMAKTIAASAAYLNTSKGTCGLNHLTHMIAHMMVGRFLENGQLPSIPDLSEFGPNHVCNHGVPLMTVWVGRARGRSHQFESAKDRAPIARGLGGCWRPRKNSGVFAVVCMS